jgi:hypothetical protein
MPFLKRWQASMTCWRRSTASRATATGRSDGVLSENVARTEAFPLETHPRLTRASEGWRKRPGVVPGQTGPRGPAAEPDTGADDHSSAATIGGSAWESNPPFPREREAADFEDREGHRAPFASVVMVKSAVATLEAPEGEPGRRTGRKRGGNPALNWGRVT